MRHGETEWSASGRHTGRTDVPLTEAGRASARRLARRLAGREFALVLLPARARAGDRRARRLRRSREVDDDLVEFDYGEYEGLTTPEIRETRPGWNLWRTARPAARRSTRSARAPTA